jgi:hypothetical protein
VNVLVLVLVMALPLFNVVAQTGSAYADTLTNNVVAGGNDTIHAGGSTTITYSVSPTDASDPVNGCNATGSNPATMTISAPAKVTASPSTQTLTGCSNPATVTFSSNTAGNYSITVSITGGKPNSTYSTSGATFTLQVLANDTTAPDLHLPGSPVVAEATGPSGAVVPYAASATDVDDTVSSFSCSPASGSTFALGNTTVNCSATDSHNNTSEGSFTVTVRDTTGPAISGTPSDFSVEATSASGATATYTNPTATDLVDGTRPVTCSPASGSTFPLGTDKVTCTASDTRGNTSTSTFNVVVQDTKAPILSLPADQTLEATSAQGASLTFTATSNDLVDGNRPVSCVLDSDGTTAVTSPHTFPIGATKVDCSASDATDNTAAGSFTITVQDTTAPVIASHGNVTAEATGPTGAVVSYTSPSTSDAVDGPGTASCAPASGSTFALGTTTVTCNATDATGNKATATTFSVTVQDTTPPSLSLPSDITAEATDPSGATVTFSASASDLVDGSVAVDCLPASGTTFALGKTTVTCAAHDAHNNIASNTFNVTVRDTTPPTTGASATKGTDATPPAYDFGTWTNATPVNVSISASDAVGLGSISYSVNGGTPSTTTVTGTSASVPVTFSVSGVYNLSYSATDAAGNTSTTGSKTVKIDTINPNLSGVPTTKPSGTDASGTDWYNNAVSIHWTCSDPDLAQGVPGSGIAGSCPDNSTINNEGRGLTASASVSDNAGNSSGTVASSPAVNIDKTAPTISGQVVNTDGTPRSPNAAGWYNSAVKVHFTASDPKLADGNPGSGVANKTDDVAVTTDGANQSVPGSATDNAGNTSAVYSVNGINIDTQAPVSSAELQCTSTNGWCKGSKATVVISAQDQADLSGVKEIDYSTNGGKSWTMSTASPTSVSIPLNGSGHASVSYYSVDNAGNTESPVNVQDIKYDNMAPAITHTLTPAANAAGWNNTNLSVGFGITDEAGGSGVDTSTIQCGPGGTADTVNNACNVPVTNETSGLNVTAGASDIAGNAATDGVTVKLDKTRPTISGAPTSSPNANNWYNSSVTVKFTCADQGAVQSGIASCDGWSGTSNNGVTVSTNGSNQSVTGQATDNADNTQSATVTGINIDSLAPTVTINGIVNGSAYTLGSVPAPSCSATDNGPSGIDGACTGTLTGGNSNGTGTFTYTARATDKAGNTTVVTATYTVDYRWDGFLQPINDTAHQVGVSTSIFKGGSTVPVKFQLKDANGNIVQATSAPVWIVPAKGSSVSSPVDETLYSDPADSATTYRWDATGQQYIYNWGTSKSQAGNYWRIGVKLDDGTTQFVNIGLR